MKHACKFVTAVHGSIRFIPRAFQIFEKRGVELWTGGIFVVWKKKREAILPPSPLSIILKSILFKHVIEQHLLRISIFFELVSLSLSL